SSLASTGFDGHAATGWLQTQAPVTPGSEITLLLTIWDSGDGVLDSTVLLDKFAWSADPPTGPTTPPVPTTPPSPTSPPRPRRPPPPWRCAAAPPTLPNSAPRGGPLTRALPAFAGRAEQNPQNGGCPWGFLGGSRSRERPRRILNNGGCWGGESASPSRPSR